METNLMQSFTNVPLAITNTVMGKVVSITSSDNVWEATLLAVLPWVLLVAFALLVLWSLPKLQAYLMGVTPVVFDGLLVTLLAGFIFSQTFFGSDDSYHYVNPFSLYWLKYGFGLAAAVMLALKSFRYGLSPKEAKPAALTEEKIRALIVEALKTKPPVEPAPNQIEPKGP